MTGIPPAAVPEAAAAPVAADLARFAADVRDHLTRRPRQLPSRYLYDELGSALFEAICRLPWYRITRAENALLVAARDDLARRLVPLTAVIELGSGSGEKMRTLLSAPAFGAHPVTLHLVDLSRSALESAQRTLARVAHRGVITHVASYEAGLADAARRLDPAGRALILFLGSNIGNFDAAEARAFLGSVRADLRTGDALLLGADLVKPESELRLAYDDPVGVTAAFNRNVLLRLNRELGADFDLSQWAHRAAWNESASRVEMHLVAESDQRVTIPAAGLELELRAGETIWTESSYKYRPSDIDALLDAAGFRVSTRWTDRPNAFALTLAEAV